MQVFNGNNFAEVYKQSLTYLFNAPMYESKPRGKKIKENTNVALVFDDPVQSMYSNIRRSSQFKYIAAELLWYFLGRDDVDFISKYASFWKAIQNEDGSINSSYGNLLFTKKNRYGISQYGWAHDSLVNDTDTRQAIMHFNLPEHQHITNKDFVCTMYGIFHIRDNKLHFKINMRSNDAILGTPTDVAFFTALQQQMLLHLRLNYPDLQLGSYTHVMDSYHIYYKHFKLVEDMIEHEFTPISSPLITENLISNSGTPSETLTLMGKYHADDILLSQDPMYKWIQNTMNDEATV
jgi:thymidylate synthase